jgi:hypothetical protein
MLFTTTLVAACVLSLRSETLARFVGFVLYFALLFWAYCLALKRWKRHDELTNRAREDGGGNPTT